MSSDRAAQKLKVQAIKDALATSLPAKFLATHECFVSGLGNGVTKVRLQLKIGTGLTGEGSVPDGETTP